MKRTPNSQSGFTVVETMVVVAMVAVLGAIALPSLTGQSGNATGDSEVEALFAELAAREQQYAVDNGKYLSTSASETATFPAIPSPAAQPLGALPATWQTLKVRTPDSSARCGYVVIAGSAGDAAGSVAATSFGFTPPAGNWYYVLAHCDLDGNNAIDSFYFASSVDPAIKKLNYGN